MTTTAPKLMAVQGAALLVAGAFIVIGVLGFIPGVTTDYGLLDWAGHNSGANLGVFAVSGLHNTLHLVSGFVGFDDGPHLRRRRAPNFLGRGLFYLDHCGCTDCSWRPGQTAPQPPARPTAQTTGCISGSGHRPMVLLGLTLAGQRDPTKRRRRRGQRKG